MNDFGVEHATASRPPTRTKARRVNRHSKVLRVRPDQCWLAALGEPSVRPPRCYGLSNLECAQPGQALQSQRQGRARHADAHAGSARRLARGRHRAASPSAKSQGPAALSLPVARGERFRRHQACKPVNPFVVSTIRARDWPAEPTLSGWDEALRASRHTLASSPPCAR